MNGPDACQQDPTHPQRLMQIDPDAPGLPDLLRGEGAPVMPALAWAGVLVLLPLLIAGTVVCWGAVL